MRRTQERGAISENRKFYRSETPEEASQTKVRSAREDGNGRDTRRVSWGDDVSHVAGARVRNLCLIILSTLFFSGCCVSFNEYESNRQRVSERISNLSKEIWELELTVMDKQDKPEVKVREEQKIREQIHNLENQLQGLDK